MQMDLDLKVDSLMDKSNMARWFLQTGTCMKANTTTTVLRVRVFTRGLMVGNMMECGTRT